MISRFNLYIASNVHEVRFNETEVHTGNLGMLSTSSRMPGSVLELGVCPFSGFANAELQQKSMHSRSPQTKQTPHENDPQFSREHVLLWVIPELKTPEAPPPSEGERV